MAASNLSVTTTTTLYDILSMVIPGGAIIAFVGREWLTPVDNSAKIVFHCCEAEATTPGFSLPPPYLVGLLIVIGFIGLSYLVGIANNSFTRKIWKPFANNPFLIEYSVPKELRSRLLGGNVVLKWYQHPDKLIGLFRIVVFYFLLAIAFSCLFSIPDNYQACHCLTILGIIGFIGIVLALSWCLFSKLHYSTFMIKDLWKEYNLAYYYARKNRYADDIGMLEAQVGAIENSFLPLLLWASVLPFQYAIWLYLLCGALFMAAFSRQNTIYFRVFQDSYYLKQIHTPSSQTTNP